MKFTQIPINLFKEIQLNAGILVDSFTPATGEYGDIVGATSGGVTFNAAPTYEDFGSDIDNCPKDTKELKKQTGVTVTIGGNFVSVTVASAKRTAGAADISVSDSTKIVPRMDLKASDFQELWWVGDYSDKNGNNNGGFVAIRMINALSTGGFQIKSNDKGKGTFAFTFTAHTSIYTPDLVPYEIYVKEGSAESGDYEMTVVSEAGSSTGYTAITTGASAGSGESYVYQTGTNLRIPIEGSVLNGSAWTSWNGSSDISADTGLDIVVAIIDGNSKAVHAGIDVVVAKES